MSLLMPGIRKAAAFRLPGAGTTFVCRQCLRLKPRSTPAHISGLVRYGSGMSSRTTPRTTIGFTSSRKISPTLFSSTIPGAATAGSAAAAAPAQAQAAKRAFPETNSKSVGYWLVGSAVSVFGIVVFGGLTRLTESG